MRLRSRNQTQAELADVLKLLSYYPRTCNKVAHNSDIKFAGDEKIDHDLAQFAAVTREELLDFSGSAKRSEENLKQQPCWLQRF